MRSSIGGWVLNQLGDATTAKRVHDEHVRGGRIGFHRRSHGPHLKLSQRVGQRLEDYRKAALHWRPPGIRAIARSPSESGARRWAPG